MRAPFSALYAGTETPSVAFLFFFRSQKVQVPAALKYGATVVVANAVMAMPSMADPGRIFDFNITLPIITAEFLVLMVFLDRTLFGPVGKALDGKGLHSSTFQHDLRRFPHKIQPKHPLIPLEKS